MQENRRKVLKNNYYTNFQLNDMQEIILLFNLYITMKNINKETLVNGYLDTTSIIEMNYNYRKISIYNQSDKNTDFSNEIIKTYINDYLSFLCNTEILDYDILQNWIDDIKIADVSESADSATDFYDTDVINSYETFENWIDINESNSLSIFKAMQTGQFNAYHELFNNIKDDFISYLEDQLELLDEEL